MKCPICEAEIKNNIEGELKCSRCGFDDIRTEFINDEERVFWQTYVVKPCKYAYRLNHTLQNEVAILRREIKKVSPGASLIRTESSASTNSPTQPTTTMIGGWNYDDPIAHPNSASCYHKTYETTVELSDIVTTISPDRKGTIRFVAKRVGQKVGWHGNNTVGFCWRVKDTKNIIVLTGKWSNSNLTVGDAMVGKIELNNVPVGYSIDFVDYQ